MSPVAEDKHMATAFTDVRDADGSEEQATAISGGFKVLNGQIAELSAQVRGVIVGQRIQTALLLVVTAAVLAPAHLGVGRWPDRGAIVAIRRPGA